MTDWTSRVISWLTVLTAIAATIIGHAVACETKATTEHGAPLWAKTWLDDSVRKPMQTGAAAIASVAIVSKGNIVTAVGFGCNGGPEGQPIDPDADRFLTASITKTFTALAIKALIDDGIITSIDDPANDYLERITLPNWRGTEITIRHLLSHRSGFEERGFGYVRHGLTSVPADAGYAQAAIPELVREPGTLTVYANINPPILGALVEDQTGETLQAFMRTRIFLPFGMSNTELGYEEAGTSALAVPWSLTTDRYAPIPHKANAPFFAPTGSIEASAVDMARYALGVFETESDGGGTRLLTPLGGNHPSLPTIGMAWFLTEWNGTVIAQHAGAFGVFASWLVLIPETQTAVFIGWAGPPTNDGAAPFDFGELRDSFLNAALGPPEAPRFIDEPAGYPAEGVYRPERRPQKSPELILALSSSADVIHTQGGFMFRGQGPFRAIGDGAFATEPINGRAPQIIAARDGLVLESSNAWAPQTLATAPALRRKIAAVAAVIAVAVPIIAFALRLPGAWSTVLLPGAVGIAVVAAIAPGPGESSLFSDIFSARTIRLHALFVAGCLFIVSSLLPIAVVVKLNAILDGRNRLLLLSSSGAALALTTTALYLHLFSRLSLG